ncbi:MAG: hypothetical protein WA821_07095 [Anaerolineales bacterium]
MEHQSNWERQIIVRGEVVLIVIGHSSYQNIIPVGIRGPSVAGKCFLGVTGQHDRELCLNHYKIIVILQNVSVNHTRELLSEVSYTFASEKVNFPPDEHFLMSADLYPTSINSRQTNELK